MILKLHWSMGDHACYTGVPEAYFRRFGSKLGIVGNTLYDDLWKLNSFVDMKPREDDQTYLLRVEDLAIKEDWKMYRPQRIFFEMTGIMPSREEVQPKLYRTRNPVKGRIAICEDAGWCSRRGYTYFNCLVSDLNYFGYETCQIRNFDGFGPKQITCAKQELSLSLDNTIEFLATCEFYIGYDSGLAHLSAGVGTPYIMLTAATPPVVARHDLCVYVVEACNHCCLEFCDKNCLENCANYNEAIIEEIKKCMGS